MIAPLEHYMVCGRFQVRVKAFIGHEVRESCSKTRFCCQGTSGSFPNAWNDFERLGSSCSMLRTKMFFQNSSKFEILKKIAQRSRYMKHFSMLFYTHQIWCFTQLPRCHLLPFDVHQVVQILSMLSLSLWYLKIVKKLLKNEILSRIASSKFHDFILTRQASCWFLQMPVTSSIAPRILLRLIAT